jgi:hypothetical protein
MAWRQEIVDFLATEGRVIIAAPGSFVLVVVVAAVLIWGGLSWKKTYACASGDSNML